MKLENLMYLPEIERLQSISSAAALFHVRQTTLSAAVSAMEDELGFPIFRRTPNGVTPTEEGRELIELARRITVQYEELTRLKSDLSIVPTIPVLASHIVTNEIAVPLAEMFYLFESRGNLSFEEYPSSLVITKLQQSIANIGIAFLTSREVRAVREDRKRTGIVVEEFFTDQLHVLVRRGHHLASETTVSAEKLKTARIAMFSTRQMDKILGDVLMKCPYVVTFSDFNLIKAAVGSGEFVAVMTRFGSGWPNDLPEDHILIPLVNTAEKNLLHLCLLHREESMLRSSEKILISCIREYLPQRAPDKTPTIGEMGG